MHKVQWLRDDSWKTLVGLYHFGSYLSLSESRPLTNEEAQDIFERIKLKLPNEKLRLISL